MKLCALILGLSVAVASAGELANQFPKHSKKRVFPPPYPPFPAAISGIQQLGIERTACFGTCPIYTIIVNSDGTFRYHGENFTKRRGDWHGSVDLARLQFVMRYVVEMGFFDLGDEYMMNETDAPGTYIMVVTRTRKKIIYNYGDCGPAKLEALEYMIDHLLEDAKWQR